jgi:hypothetical protein
MLHLSQHKDKGSWSRLKFVRFWSGFKSYLVKATVPRGEIPTLCRLRALSCEQWRYGRNQMHMIRLYVQFQHFDLFFLWFIGNCRSEQAFAPRYRVQEILYHTW